MLVYGDDSADERQERVSAIGVVVGPDELWKNLESKWVGRLGSVPFHAKNCESDQGDFSIFCHRQNKELYRDLAILLADSGLRGFSIGIDLIAQKKVFPDSPDIAYYKSFAEILEQVKQWAVRLDDIAEFTFDISTVNRYSATYIYSMVRENDRECFNHFHAKFSTVSASESPRVQTADMVAFEGMKALDHAIGPIKRTRRSWRALRATGRFDAIGFGEEWFADFKANYHKLETTLGYTHRDYLDWLNSTGRQHSISNMFFFTNLMWKKKSQSE